MSNLLLYLKIISTIIKGHYICNVLFNWLRSYPATDKKTGSDDVLFTKTTFHYILSAATPYSSRNKGQSLSMNGNEVYLTNAKHKYHIVT